MKRFSSALAVAACGSFLVSGAAFADNNSNHSGKFGIRGSQMAGLAGNANHPGSMGAVGFAYGISSSMTAAVNFGFSSSSTTQTVSGTESSQSTSQWGLGAEFDYKIIKGSEAATYLNAGFNLANMDQGGSVAGTSGGVKYSDWGLGIGLKGEWSPVKKMSFSTGLGIGLSPNGAGQQVGTTYPDEAEDETEYGGMDMGIQADLLGNAAVTLWF